MTVRTARQTAQSVATRRTYLALWKLHVLQAVLVLQKLLTHRPRAARQFAALVPGATTDGASLVLQELQRQQLELPAATNVLQGLLPRSVQPIVQTALLASMTMTVLQKPNVLSAPRGDLKRLLHGYTCVMVCVL